MGRDAIGTHCELTVSTVELNVVASSQSASLPLQDDTVKHR